MRAETSAVEWPEGKSFAFTVFDDPDSQTVASGRIVYDFLADCGFRTTKAVWPLGPIREPSDYGGSCDDPEYLAWCLELQRAGFEIALHNARNHTSTREETREGLERFRELFGHDPHSMANHYYCDENIYHGRDRLSGVRRLVYDAATLGRNRSFFGHVPDHELFWGDLCRDRIRYVRNFVFDDIDTLSACPFLPYRDPDRPFVQAWFACSEGNRRETFVEQVREENQDRLAARGGACIMYTHFGHAYVEDGRLDAEFRRLMQRLAGMNGWFVPVHELLDHLAARRGVHTITPAERRALEWRWLRKKLLRGTA